MNKLQPVANYLLILPSDGEEKTSGGIYIPDSAKEKPQEGIVEGKGNGASEEIAVGDKVLYKKFAGTQVSFADKEYLLVQDSDVLAKVVSVDAI